MHLINKHIKRKNNKPSPKLKELVGKYTDILVSDLSQDFSNLKFEIKNSIYPKSESKYIKVFKDDLLLATYSIRAHMPINPNNNIKYLHIGFFSTVEAIKGEIKNHLFNLYPELNIKKEKLSEIKTISQKEINNHLMKSKLLIQNNKLTIKQKAEIYIKRNKKYILEIFNLYPMLTIGSINSILKIHDIELCYEIINILIKSKDLSENYFIYNSENKRYEISYQETGIIGYSRKEIKNGTKN